MNLLVRKKGSADGPDEPPDVALASHESFFHLKVHMNLQMNLFLHMKVHMKVQKRLQVRVHKGWDPSSTYRDEFFQKKTCCGYKTAKSPKIKGKFKSKIPRGLSINFNA